MAQEELLRPSDVFTPTRAPLRETNVYVSRVDAEEELTSAIEQGHTPVIFGEFGVGKTSLALLHFRRESQEDRLIHYTNPEGKTLDDVYKQALEQLGYTVEVSREHSSASSIDGSVSGGLWATIKARVAINASTSAKTSSELVVRSPTDAGILNLLRDDRMVILIDELHRANDTFKSDLVRLVKSLSDRGDEFPILVMAGTSTQPEQLVQLDQGVDRLLREVPIRPLSQIESEQIIELGFQRLAIEVTSDTRDRVVETAAGAPSLLHALCLEAAVNTRKRDDRELSHEDIDGAVRKVVERTNYRLTERYMKATNTMGVKRYRAQILRAAAASDSGFITMEMLVPAVSALVGEEVPRTSLSGPLRELKSEEYGAILSDVPRADDQGRHYNLTVFTDPQMKAYVRFLSVVESQGLLDGVVQEDH